MAVDHGDDAMMYGYLPERVGVFDDKFHEMMFWMYCPVMTPSQYLTLPSNLEQFRPLVKAALRHEDDINYGSLDDAYVYLTAKTLWVEGTHIGNRPGWHSDGFGTDDVNYIWCDRAPTDFLFLATPVELSSDCDESMRQMEALAKPGGSGQIVTYGDNPLLRLTPSVIHRSPVQFEAGMRTFVKVSISKNRYNLIGNSVNHGMHEKWVLVPREPKRNHPHKDSI